MQKIAVYIISGLATDERVFRNIHFPEFAEVHFIAWKKPLRKETLDAYVDRLIKEIDQSKPFVLLGLSFGGVVAQQIAKKIDPLETVLISSITSPKEIPWYFRLIGKLKLNRIFPFGFFKFPNFFLNWIFGAKSRDDKKLLAGILRDADTALIRWSVEQLLSWRSENNPEPIFRMHGTNDKLLPLKNKNADAILSGGGHLMVYNKADEVEVILEGVFVDLRSHLLRGEKKEDFN
jgi:pimeloyl-ACP methyl ester carboxylesterase